MANGWRHQWDDDSESLHRKWLEITKHLFLTDWPQGVPGTSGRPKAHQVSERHINPMATEFPRKAHQHPKRHINPT